MYEVVDASYVLRIFRLGLREVWWRSTVGTRPVGSEKVMWKVYGVLHSRRRGRKVNVIVAMSAGSVQELYKSYRCESF